ncbi:MAG: hypothetical protein KDE00_09980 [Rhodobacteraceae bacterium]|nr:hypothetical protein [Paracoccaceae bacterium]
MRILSARIQRARRIRLDGRVEALVALTVDADGGVIHPRVLVAAPSTAPGAPPLRERLLAAAKLAFAMQPRSGARARAA